MIGVSTSLSVVCVLIIVICIISCAYCCIVKFKMCTPIYDPIQHEHIYENENTEQVIMNFRAIDNIFSLGVLYTAKIKWLK